MNENNYVPIIRVTEGQKLWMPNEESCYEMEKKLNSFGVKTRAGCPCGTDYWSIYIISIPNNLVDTYQKMG